LTGSVKEAKKPRGRQPLKMKRSVTAENVNNNDLTTAGKETISTAATAPSKIPTTSRPNNKKDRRHRYTIPLASMLTQQQKETLKPLSKQQQQLEKFSMNIQEAVAAQVSTESCQLPAELPKQLPQSSTATTTTTGTDLATPAAVDDDLAPTTAKKLKDLPPSTTTTSSEDEQQQLRNILMGSNNNSSHNATGSPSNSLGFLNAKKAHPASYLRRTREQRRSIEQHQRQSAATAAAEVVSKVPATPTAAATQQPAQPLAEMLETTTTTTTTTTTILITKKSEQEEKAGTAAVVASPSYSSAVDDTDDGLTQQNRNRKVLEWTTNKLQDPAAYESDLPSAKNTNNEAEETEDYEEIDAVKMSSGCDYSFGDSLDEEAPSSFKNIVKQEQQQKQ
jgi:hypothetical protein